MNHKWEKDESFIPDKDYSYYRKELERHKCKVCGCKRTKVKLIFNKYPEMEYDRSGTAHWDKYAPDCIDWNDNTLD